MRKLIGIALSLVLALGVAVLSLPQTAQAHCDSVNGPVVAAAKAALEAGNVKLILPYVKEDAETELTAAFHHALQVRKLGDEGARLADTYFFETAVRLHRAGEGAAYTGLKYEADFGPALHEAELSLSTGNLWDVRAVLIDEIAKGIEQRYHAVVEAREKAAHEGTVAADRERAEAELLYEIYIHGIYQAAAGPAPHGAAGAHEHVE
ncbi:MAG TPA: DUF6448 family protein [Symbiobacteriaceae bacterium]|nr:DUF6448 family protein [Symbiobacteriaceae bacterium]